MDHLVQPPCQSRLHRTLSRRVLNISREGDSTAFLGSLFQCSITLRVTKLFLMFSWNFLCFSLCLLPLTSKSIEAKGTTVVRKFNRNPKLKSRTGRGLFHRVCSVRGTICILVQELKLNMSFPVLILIHLSKETNFFKVLWMK